MLRFEYKVLNEVNQFNIQQKSLNVNLINKYKDKYPTLRRVRITEDTKGVALCTNSELIGIINVDIPRKYIISLEVFKPYKGRGFSYKLLDIAIRLGAKNLSVRKTNHIAIETYKKHGWHIKNEDDYMYYMIK